MRPILPDAQLFLVPVWSRPDGAHNKWDDRPLVWFPWMGILLMYLQLRTFVLLLGIILFEVQVPSWFVLISPWLGHNWFLVIPGQHDLVMSTFFWLDIFFALFHYFLISQRGCGFILSSRSHALSVKQPSRVFIQFLVWDLHSRGSCFFASTKLCPDYTRSTFGTKDLWLRRRIRNPVTLVYLQFVLLLGRYLQIRSFRDGAMYLEQLTLHLPGRPRYQQLGLWH